jgi:hypothetical protein
MEYNPPTFPLKKKFKSQQLTGKVMLSCFWDSEGIILKQYQEWRELIKGACITSQNSQFSVNTKDNYIDNISGSHSEDYEVCGTV